MREPISNIRPVCPSHAPCAGKYTDYNPYFFIGKIIKKAFKAEDNIHNIRMEHMWVTIKAVIGNDLEGILNNDPIFVPNLKCGDTVKVSLCQIEEVFGEN
jgi:hypothetical protein